MLTIAVVGSKRSGKTTGIEALTRGLTERGYKVATIKHIPEVDFTIDTQNKDTWRHANAGAFIVVSVAPKEIATIKKVDTSKYDLRGIVEGFVDEVDVIILEGFRRLVGRDPRVPKIVAVKTVEEALEASKDYEPILAFVGPPRTKATRLETPHVDVIKEPERLVSMVNEKVAVSVKRREKLKAELTVQIDKRNLPLKPFVQEIMRKTVLAMVSTLKKTKIRGDEKVFITIQGASEDE